MQSARFHLALALIALFTIPLAIIAFNWAGEDCWITYRYAENLANGHGLVFNTTDVTRADRVEGFSNLSFTLLLAAIDRLGGSVVYGSRWAAAISVGVAVWLLGLFGGAWDPERRRRALHLLAPALLALQPLVQYQVGRALESTFYMALIVLAALLFVRRWTVAASVVLGLVAMTRPEGFLFIVPFALVWLWEVWASRRDEHPSASVGTLAALVIPWAVIVAALFVWRFAYYGHWFPNSVALKTSPGGFLANPSLRLVRDFVISWSFLPALVPLAFAGWSSMPFEKRRGLLLIGLLMAWQLAFILGVGNVPAETYRHFIPIIPFACLCLQEVAGKGLTLMKSRALRSYAIIALLALNFFTIDNKDGTRTRLHVRVKEFFLNYGGGFNNPVRQFAFLWDWFHHPPIRLDTVAGEWVHDHLPPNALIAADQMGQFAYHAGQPMLDMFGLMDETIAREGLNPDHVFARNPDYVVFMYVIPQGDYTPFQANLRADPRFAERYRLRWRLRQDLPPELQPYEFHVFVRRDHDDGQPVETVTLPGSVEDCDRFWRARGA